MKTTNEVRRIQDQLRRSHEGPAWHGPALREILSDVTAERAAARPVAAHSIWEIVLHIAAWEKVARNGIIGYPVDLSDEDDWPSVEDTSEGAWQVALTSLEEAHARLQEALALLTDGDLERTVAGRSYDVYVLLHGVVQHNLYHAGQLILLKKAV